AARSNKATCWAGNPSAALAAIPKKNIEENLVDVRFTYDVNGVLQIEATLLSTNVRHELILQQNPGVLTDCEIRARLEALAELKIHPRDEQPNLALIARADRLFAENLGPARDQIQQWLVQFMSTLESQDKILIERQRKEFSDAMNTMESRFD
ncbi:MAG: hypothetical protein ABI644_04450, partial [Arenimonas sp.]